ncbi:MAG: MarR family transcriptional regulator [Oscillospiraceae bacterium]|jgi:DNA-binding MarR family transcriptional regulator|nr:MarR family transcriptional regulator [Oscillospiraceae bacterium]
MDQEISKLVHAIVNARRAYLRSWLEPLGVTSGQPAVLLYLADHDGSIQRDIAANVRVRAASVVSVLDGLERGGLVKREPDPDDRRAWRIFLTDSGRSTCESVRSLFSQLDALTLTGVPESSKPALLSTLQTVVANFGAEG